MKKQKLHLLPLETPFLRKIKTGVQYYDSSHYTNFDSNSIEIRPFKQPPNDDHCKTDLIFLKILQGLNSSNMKYLRKLDISIEASFLFQSLTIRRLRLTLSRNFKNLSQLNLRLQACENLSDNNFPSLLDALTKGMRNLTRVNLHFLSCPEISDHSLKNLKPMIFKGCKQLKKLEVVISGYYHRFEFEKNHYFDPKMDRWLEDKTSYHDETWGPGSTRITPKGAERLCFNLGRYCKNLQFLAFEIPVLIGNNQMRIEQFVKMVTKMPNLKHLNLSLAAQVNDGYIDKVSFIIGQKLKNLQSLTLWFHGKNKEITDKGLKKLASNIFPALSKLHYFAFCLDERNGITDDGVRDFGSDIANHLKNLETLILNFSESNSLTGTVPSKLTQAFKNSLISLRKLVLNFDWAGDLDGRKERYPLFLPENVENLDLYLYHADCLIQESWFNLKQFSIVIGSSRYDTDFLDMFSKESLSMKNLTQLKLIFISPNKVTDEKVRELTLAIGKNLQNLISLDLGFSYCKLLTSKCFFWIGQNLCKNLKKLAHFHLRFYQVQPSHSQDLMDLVSLIAAKLQELESLTLFFFGVLKRSEIKSTLDSICPLITENLKKLKKLTFALSLWRGLEGIEEEEDEEDEELEMTHEERTELRKQMRKQLCHIPKLYIS